METQQATTLTVVAEGARGSITLNRPDKLNPLSTVTLEELVSAARWFDARPAVKVVVIAGSGRSFCAGADLAAFAAAADGAAAMREAADAGRRMAEAIEAMRAVTVVRLHGHCVGGGVVLAAACDLRVAAQDTRFSIPEVDLGIPLAWGGIPRLVREIGPSLTKELVMTCRSFDAAEAKAAGFLNRVVPAADLDTEVDGLVDQLAGKSTLTLCGTKRQVNAVAEGMVATVRSWNDADALVTALHDSESQAAAMAYLERVSRR
ncbi:putative enoyl-CoA hydratase echA8 [Mycolicibacter terrae]|jgi:enoyl-CoA hydratase/3-hydroxypropionyl-coenzyme A dehydratase|uniref:Enoyl-CoA hydratase echA8 n=1 Tax=Mycolicibacter terrae TaxID=1788 RepID=A0AAD1HY54_9MYCO|nr:enoyl-CoA hydratase/isomerase family protein [Mycolicibacter terrae]ORW97413.1 enoyl-CoA hydratase [Mycolicibacter terrae]BBX22550.1 putative enoyl-CoA hydratase echA8 [Mycolicibacter terrae]SNV74282.1 enoyl-CoA dehydratase EchA8_3 [Mycolicibacter terrae]